MWIKSIYGMAAFKRLKLYICGAEILTITFECQSTHSITVDINLEKVKMTRRFIYIFLLNSICCVRAG